MRIVTLAGIARMVNVAHEKTEISHMGIKLNEVRSHRAKGYTVGEAADSYHSFD